MQRWNRLAEKGRGDHSLTYIHKQRQGWMTTDNDKYKQTQTNTHIQIQLQSRIHMMTITIRDIHMQHANRHKQRQMCM